MGVEFHQEVFVGCFVHLLKSDVNKELIMDQKCERGHKFADLVPRIAMTAFNIIAVNFVSDINDKMARGPIQVQMKQHQQKENQ